MRVHGNAGIGMRGRLHDLTGFRRSHAHAVGESVDAAWLRKLRFPETKLAILFAQLIELLLFRLHAVGAFNGAEVLEAVDHGERKQHGDRGREDAQQQVSGPAYPHNRATNVVLRDGSTVHVRPVRPEDHDAIRAFLAKEFVGCDPVVDLGFGRGEFMDLLGELGV